MKNKDKDKQEKHGKCTVTWASHIGTDTHVHVCKLDTVNGKHPGRKHECSCGDTHS